jgi:hypothetical protein
MFKRGWLVASLCLSCQTVLAQKHVHGEGQLLIAQEQQQWQFHFILPAVNLLGFEHIPESAEQKQILMNIVSKVEDADKMITLPASCNLLSMSHSLVDFEANSSASAHSHVHQKEISADVKPAHADISITYIFNCKDKPDSAIARLFEWSTRLHILNTQWVTNGQQGSAQLKPPSNIVRFTR